jgi:hypothetical protein
MATPSVASIGAKGAAGPSTPLTVPLPTGIVANDILLLCVENSSGQLITLSDAQGFAQIGSTLTDGGAGQTEIAVFWKRAAGGDNAPTLASPGDGAAAHLCAGIVRITGIRTTGNPWVDAPVTGADPTISNPSTLTATGGTTTVDNVLVVVLASQGADTETPQYSNWANASLTAVAEAMDYSTSLGNGGGIAVATGIKATAGTVTETTASIASANLADAFMTLFLAGADATAGGPPMVQAVGAMAAVGASSAPLVVPLPTGVVANDILLLAVENSAGANISLSDAQGFVQIGSTVSDGSQTSLAVFWKRALGVPPGNTAPTLAGTGGGNGHYCAGIVRVGNCRTTGDPWADAPVTGSSAPADTALTATGGTTSEGDVLVVVIASQGTDTDTPQYSSWANASLTAVTEVMDYASSLGGGGGVAVATGIKTAPGLVATTTASLATAAPDAFMTLFLVGAEPTPPPPLIGSRAADESGIGRISSRTETED